MWVDTTWNEITAFSEHDIVSVYFIVISIHCLLGKQKRRWKKGKFLWFLGTRQKWFKSLQLREKMIISQVFHPYLSPCISWVFINLNECYDFFLVLFFMTSSCINVRFYYFNAHVYVLLRRILTFFHLLRSSCIKHMLVIITSFYMRKLKSSHPVKREKKKASWKSHKFHLQKKRNICCALL